MEWLTVLRELGSAGAVAGLAIYVIVYQGNIIRENTGVLRELVVLIKQIHGDLSDQRGRRRDDRENA
jgi:hypothetical protein